MDRGVREKVGEMPYLVSSNCEGCVEEQDTMFCPFCQISVNQHTSFELGIDFQKMGIEKVDWD